MPKFLIEASYTAEGARGIAKDGGSKRKAFITEMAKKAGGTLESFHWRVSAEPGQGFVRKPAGFTKGASWSPSVEWEVTPNDEVVYAAVITITGPIGVPHK